MFTFFDLHLTIFAIANYVIEIGVSEGSLKRGNSYTPHINYIIMMPFNKLYFQFISYLNHNFMFYWYKYSQNKIMRKWEILKFYDAVYVIQAAVL